VRKKSDARLQDEDDCSSHCPPPYRNGQRLGYPARVRATIIQRDQFFFQAVVDHPHNQIVGQQRWCANIETDFGFGFFNRPQMVGHKLDNSARAELHGFFVAVSPFSLNEWRIFAITRHGLF
jgi:hypothetical protein